MVELSVGPENLNIVKRETVQHVNGQIWTDFVILGVILSRSWPKIAFFRDTEADSIERMPRRNVDGSFCLIHKFH